LYVVKRYVVVLLNKQEDGMALKQQEERSHLVKAEGNFEDHPYFTIGNQRSGDGVIHYSNTIRTRDGQELQQTWTIRAVQGLGLPGSLDQDVYVALLQLIEQRGGVPDDGWISFSLYELVQLLRRTHGGRDYMQIKQSLLRLSSTTIQSDNAFYRKSQKSYLTDSFHLLDRVKHSETSDGHGRAEKTSVKLSDYFVESYKADYLKGLDVDFYWSLNSPVAKRLYRFIDKKRNYQRRWEVELFSLRDRIPLSAYKYPSKIKEKLAPAHEELEQKGFLEQVTYRKNPAGSNLVCYEIHEGFASRRPAARVEATPEVVIAIERLKAEGVRGDVAEDLVANHGPERCLRFAEAVPYQKNLRNAPGWLRKAIENGYELDVPSADPGSNTNGASAIAAREADEAEETRSEDIPPPPPDVAPPDPDPAAQDVWTQMLDAVSDKIETPSLRVWFDGTVPTGFDGERLTISVPNSFAKEYIETRFLDMLEGALREQTGALHAALEVVVQPGGDI
jgi:hypothetical protein